MHASLNKRSPRQHEQVRHARDDALARARRRKRERESYGNRMRDEEWEEALDEALGVA